MPRDADREYDKTSLNVLEYDGVHRDYAAHFFRWGYISQNVIRRGDRVLDIGCGVRAPLVRMIQNTEGSLSMLPSLYLGVDINRRPKNVFGVKWAKFLYDFNFSEQWHELTNVKPFDVVTCLEVVEHMRMPSVMKLLRGALALMADDGRLVLSTPVFNGRAAKNHINEMTVAQLQSAFDKTGWEVEKRFGTFISHNDVRRVASEPQMAVLDDIRQYYGGAVAACFLAPLFPDHARNNVWICKKGDLL